MVCEKPEKELNSNDHHNPCSIDVATTAMSCRFISTVFES